MFVTTLIKASLFKKIIESTKELVTNVNINFTESEIKFTSMDSSHVVLVSVFLKSKSFEKYDYNKEETIVKITVKQNKKIVKFTSSGDFNNECINTLKKKKVVSMMKSLSKQEII
ncbi:12403_t:CDS:2 [Cetraspora pellucida]|uniref:12403_t:CDS:1 n=1 Tax=Cetraspora pellucida TaxID=1433469 RepID=A0ACA9KBM6_9GLOM|nr:12403_t:CDS:2 [Cetraspora pellucida]